jgi:hypothetical protein
VTQFQLLRRASQIRISSGAPILSHCLRCKNYRRFYGICKEALADQPRDLTESFRCIRDLGIWQFDTCYPSQPVAQPEGVSGYWLKVPHFIGFPCDCPKSLVFRKRATWREFAESLQPQPQISRFHGDDWRRQVRAPLSGRGGSEFALFRTARWRWGCAAIVRRNRFRKLDVPLSAPGADCVKTFFLRQNCTQPGTSRVDTTV